MQVNPTKLYEDFRNAFIKEVPESIRHYVLARQENPNYCIDQPGTGKSNTDILWEVNSILSLHKNQSIEMLNSKVNKALADYLLRSKIAEPAVKSALKVFQTLCVSHYCVILPTMARLSLAYQLSTNAEIKNLALVSKAFYEAIRGTSRINYELCGEARSLSRNLRLLAFSNKPNLISIYAKEAPITMSLRNMVDALESFGQSAWLGQALYVPNGGNSSNTVPTTASLTVEKAFQDENYASVIHLFAQEVEKALKSSSPCSDSFISQKFAIVLLDKKIQLLFQGLGLFKNVMTPSNQETYVNPTSPILHRIHASIEQQIT